ncbi:MAG TPA: S8 family serine peptidase [Gemmatimonadales bacterium]|jgi:subtilisin family serine protease|nr:S8 family serine peptidase [Gemmatimonadales bacterium]
MLKPIAVLSLVLGAACASTKAITKPTPVKPPPASTPAIVPDVSRAATPHPAIDPAVAYMFGLMPLKSTGVDFFRSLHPTYDGRGVLIAILDSGIDPGVPGLVVTSTGAPKIIELRDFSGEGRVVLSAFPAPTESELKGAARIGRLTTATTWYRGVFRELPLGRPPAGDVNGNGRNTDEFPVVVVKASDGWVAFLDSNLDGSFEDEMPLHDYRQGREMVALGKKPIDIVANFNESDGAPVLDLFFDTSGHGTHVAGIAAGYNLFDVAGFNGVAPGAQIIGLKIANNARGGVTVHGSMMRAIDYAARYAAQRNMPLVLNMSFGVGNEHEGRAVIDSIIDAFLLTHPDAVFAISAGNDGPGWSTLGFPGSADLALSVGAAYPGVFTAPPQPGVPPARDVLGWFSSRGGELAKPDIVTPGVAFSSVPRWDIGNEIKGGTSMASPHAAGLAACLVSALAQEGRRAMAADIVQALRVSARPFNGARIIDDGAGMPVLETAYEWLEGGHQGSIYAVKAATGVTAAFRRNGFAGQQDSVETFTVRHLAGLRAAEFALRANVPWLSVDNSVDAAPRATQIDVTYSRSALTAPGVYVGTVTAFNPRDIVAGPLFTLVNTVIIPTDLTTKVLFDERRVVGPATVQRYFLRVSPAGATLRATVTLPDSLSQEATVRLYEPNGAPARTAPDDIDIGQQQPGTAVITVRAEDLVVGVYELDVVAPPLTAATATIRAELGPVALSPTPSPTPSGTTLEASSVTTGQGSTASGEVVYRLVGAERGYAIAGRGQPAESLHVRAPPWAKRMEVDLEVPADLWDELTDLSVTVYDSTGQQVRGGNEPINYAFGRMSLALSDSTIGIPLTIEFYPAFARLPGHSWRGTARVRFLGPDEPIGEGGALSVVAGGRSVIRLPNPPSLDMPEGFGTLIETRVTTLTGAVAARRTVVAPASRGAGGGGGGGGGSR